MLMLNHRIQTVDMAVRHFRILIRFVLVLAVARAPRRHFAHGARHIILVRCAGVNGVGFRFRVLRRNG